ncbi:TniB family NTP-binding protein [Herbaspirillum huttiense]|uniref:TniB family NTP-binding protein n=1 Tax=Herbaspirillum huttiense TaxID=863372 RepID=UPI0031DD1E4D
MSAELFSDPEKMDAPWGKPAAVEREHSLYLAPEEKVAAVRRIRVLHPAYDNAIQFVQRTFDKFGRFEDPGGGRIIAQSGGGKSAVVQHMVEKYPKIDTPERLIVPVLAISVSSAPRIGSILDSILAECSFFLKSSKLRATEDLKIPGKVDSVIEAFARCQVRLLMVDEFSHVGERKQGPMSKEITNTMKLIYSATKVGQIFLGEENANLPFEQNGQLRTRLPGMISLHMFEYGSEFLGVLQSFDEQLPMRYQAGLAAPDISFALHAASGGQMRTLVKILSEAVYIAASSDDNKISHKHLKIAYDYVTGGDPKLHNPFSAIGK